METVGVSIVKVPEPKPRRFAVIPVDDDAWKTDLTTHQSEMAALSNDLAFEIDRIEDQVGVRAVVHVNQPDERFGGRGNPNLAGGAVSRLGDNRDWNIIKAGTQIPLPLAGDMPASATDSAPSQPKYYETADVAFSDAERLGFYGRTGSMKLDT